MTTLVEFIEARLAEDDQRYGSVHDLRCELTMTAGFGGPCTCGWAPRLLREVEMKQRLLDTARIMSQGGPAGTAYEFGQRLLRNLAWPYADHPDYQTEWRSS